MCSDTLLDGGQPPSDTSICAILAGASATIGRVDTVLHFDVDVHTEVCYRQVGWSGPVFEFEIARSRCFMATVHNSVASMASMEPNKLMKVFRTWRQRVKILEFMKANKVEFAITLMRFISTDACKSV
jgi:hypothetical protein